MVAISNRMPAVNVEYDTPSGRKSKHFPEAYKARQFFTAQYKLGNNPSVKRSDTMPEVNTVPAVETKIESKPEAQTPVNGAAPKAPAKAATKPVKKPTAAPAKKGAAPAVKPPKAAAAPTKKAPPAKAAPKAAAAPKHAKVAEAIRKEILAFMRKGKQYTSREIVVGLNRTPGANEGGPVVKMLHKLAKEKIVSYGPDENSRSYAWIKN